MSLPRVTVLLAVHNGEPFLGLAVHSVLKQTYTNFELLVIDDASDDASPATLEAIRDPRLRIVRNRENVGLTKSLNRGLALTESEYVARLDADDLSFPERLARQVEFLDAHPGVAVVGTQGTPIDSRGRRIRRAEWWHREWQRATGGVALDWYRMFDTPFIHSSVMFRRSVVCDELGGYDDRYPLQEDRELWMRIARRHGLANLEERLVAMRLTPASATADPERPERRGSRERIFTIVHATMHDVLGLSDVPRQWAETWVDITDPGSSVSPEQIRELRDAIAACAMSFGRDRAIRLHHASLVARMMEKAAAVSRPLSLQLLLDFLKLDARGALLYLPRFAVAFAFGDGPFRWRRALLRRYAR